MPPVAKKKRANENVEPSIQTQDKRVSLIASNSKHHAGGQDSSPCSPAAEQGENLSHEQEGEDLEDDSMIVSESLHEEELLITGPPFPGGPMNETVLTKYRSHVAPLIWAGKDRRLLRPQQHNRKLKSWDLSKESDKFRDRIAQTGLLPLVDASFTNIHTVLVSCMVERWYPETNTFHLPIGEMTITLDDVSSILGIPIEGKAVCGPALNQEGAINMLVKELGLSEKDVREHFKGKKYTSVRMDFLMNHLESTKEMTEEDIDRRVKGYLLFLLGCTIFSDKSGTRVPVMYLSMLRNLEEVHRYSWGAAALAYLYRQLGSAAKRQAKQIGGYLTLLQAWIYEHILVGRPTLNNTYREGDPRALRWIEARSQSAMQNSMSIDYFRQILDNITTKGVDFDPYKDIRRHHPLHPIAFFSGCLITYDIIEPYNPDRVLRQFGFIQTIPRRVRSTTRIKRGASVKDYTIVHEQHIHNWMSWRDHVISVETRGSLARSQGDCVLDYLAWFNQVSHVRILNPATCIAYLGMDGSCKGDEEASMNSLAVGMIDIALQLGEREEYAHMMEVMRDLRSRLVSRSNGNEREGSCRDDEVAGMEGKDDGEAMGGKEDKEEEADAGSGHADEDSSWEDDGEEVDQKEEEEDSVTNKKDADKMKKLADKKQKVGEKEAEQKKRMAADKKKS